jgi:hypothetical protein
MSNDAFGKAQHTNLFNDYKTHPNNEGVRATKTLGEIDSNQTVHTI